MTAEDTSCHFKYMSHYCDIITQLQIIYDLLLSLGLYQGTKKPKMPDRTPNVMAEAMTIAVSDVPHHASIAPKTAPAAPQIYTLGVRSISKPTMPSYLSFGFEVLLSSMIMLT